MRDTISYVDDIEALNGRAVALYNEGRFHNLISLNPEDESKAVVLADMIGVAYAPDGTARSVTLVVLSERDIYGDPEDDSYIPFVVAVGLDVLAEGISRTDECPYKKLQQDPIALAKYESVKPRIIVLDEDDKPTGETRFNAHGEFARTPRGK